jgi:hypothetical protein
MIRPFSHLAGREKWRPDTNAIGSFQKRLPCPKEEISAILRGRGEKFVSDYMTCKGATGFNFQFLLCGRYGHFLEDLFVSNDYSTCMDL